MDDSVETWRLYRAEASVPLVGLGFVDLRAARGFLAEVQDSRWWRWNVREQVTITLDDVGNEVESQVNSYSKPNDDPPTSWTISMHPQQLDAYHLLHEVAHCIAPRWTYAGRTTGTAIPKHAEVPFHGPAFASVRLVLTEQFADPAEAAELAVAYTHFGVSAAPWDQVLADLAASRAADEDLAEVGRRHPAGMAVVKTLLRGRVGRSPDDLGWVLRTARHRARLDGSGQRPTQAQVANQISTVVPCAARDVSRVENLTAPPGDQKTYQVALCLAALFDVDPVQAQFQLGLNRDDWDVPLDALANLNADWVRLVQELDELVRSRPPRWYAGRNST